MHALFLNDAAYVAYYVEEYGSYKLSASLQMIYLYGGNSACWITTPTTTVELSC